MKTIIAISGKQLTGKDTLASLILQKLPHFRRIGIGDAIKIQYAKEKNLTYEEIIKNKHLYRNDLINLGNWGREQSDDYWLKVLIGEKNIIVPDIRVPYEADFFKKQGAILVRINSSLEQRRKRGKLVNVDDDTETALDNYNKWDMVIENNEDYDALMQQADKLIKKFIG